MGDFATQPLRSRGPLEEGTNSRTGYITLAFLGARIWAEWLHNPCILKRPLKGDKFGTGYITPAFLGAHNWAKSQHYPCVFGGPPKRGQNQKWLHHPYLLGGPQVGDFATLPLHPQGPLEEGTKSEVATSPLPSREPTTWQNCYVIPCVLGGPQKRGQNQKWPHHPYPLGSPHLGRIAM